MATAEPRGNAHVATLRIQRRILPFADVLPTLRVLIATALVISLALGGYQYFTQPQAAGAFDFTQHTVGTVGQAKNVRGIAVGDMDGDGDNDIVTVGGDDLVVYKNNGSQTFTRKVIEDIDGVRVQLIDLDKDSDLDIVATVNSDPSVRWWRNNGGLSFDGTNMGSGTSGVAYAGDIDKDGDIDIVTGTTNSSVVKLERWMNDGGGTFTATTLKSDSGVTAITIGDINANGYADIVTGGSAGLQHWDTSDGSTWSRSDIDDANENKTYLVVTDVNGDGKKDIVTANNSKNKVRWYQNVSNTSYTRNTMSDGADATTLSVVDLENDGDTDVVVAAQDDNEVAWYKNDGSQSFAKETLLSSLTNVFGMAVVDIDKDGDLDIVAANSVAGTVYWYARERIKPVATAPSGIEQSSAGNGNVTFTTTVTDEDFETTRLRVLYSFDGTTWYKPWLTNISTSVGSASLVNSDGYQVGTSNGLNTDSGPVDVTLTWDTTDGRNTGPAVTDTDGILIKVVPRDGQGDGDEATSDSFRVDNVAPEGLTELRVTDISGGEAALAWDVVTDNSSLDYAIYYGTDKTLVLNRASDVWDVSNDPALSTNQTTSTIITGLDPSTEYTFKLFVHDQFGNEASAPSVQGTTDSTGSLPGVSPTPTPSPTPEEGGLSALIGARLPSTTNGNTAPVADAGPDQVVRPGALVVLDGSGSKDADGDVLTYTWVQVSGAPRDVLSVRTKNPSFQAGDAGDAYLFRLDIRDPFGASSSDLVTIAVTENESLGAAVKISSPSNGKGAMLGISIIESIAAPINYGLLALAMLSTGLSLFERTARSLRDRASSERPFLSAGSGDTPRGRVVHYKTGQPIAGARVMIYGEGGKLKSAERTNIKGEFSTLLPQGTYVFGVQAEGFALAAAAARSLNIEEGIIYSGGNITIHDSAKPVNVMIPLKPIGQDVHSIKTSMLHAWQLVQQMARRFSWPVFIVGALLNTALVFWFSNFIYLGIEVLYVVLVVIKMVLEVRMRPAYGLVRNAITQVPLDLAVVRLFDAHSNRLVMTRVTNIQGKFFALPEPGTYTITVTKMGFAPFTRENVTIDSEEDSVLQLTAELMPVAPQAARLQFPGGAVA